MTGRRRRSSAVAAAAFVEPGYGSKSLEARLRTELGLSTPQGGGSPAPLGSGRRGAVPRPRSALRRPDGIASSGVTLQERQALMCSGQHKRTIETYCVLGRRVPRSSALAFPLHSQYPSSAACS